MNLACGVGAGLVVAISGWSRASSTQDEGRRELDRASRRPGLWAC